MSESQDYKPLTREELEELAGEPLPERAAMSLINANVAAPINLAVAANVLSDNSVAYANAGPIPGATRSRPEENPGGSHGRPGTQRLSEAHP